MLSRRFKQELFVTKQFTVKTFDVSSNGVVMAEHTIIDKPDSAMIVPLTAEGEVVFVREYYTAIDAYQLGLPKGKVDQGDPLETANRELQEEIGYRAESLVKIAEFTVTPSYLTQRTHVYLATGLVPSRLEGDELEPIETILVPLESFESRIDSGELSEARMIAALYRARSVHKHERISVI